MARTAQVRKVTAAKAVTAPKAEAVEAVTAPKARTARKVAAPKADTVKPKATPKPKAEEPKAEETVNRFAWGEHVHAEGYIWLTAEGEKAGVGLPGVKSYRMHAAQRALLADMLESGKWWDGSRRLTAQEKRDASDAIEQYDSRESWKVHGKPNGWKGLRSVESQRLMLLTLRAEKRDARSGGLVIDVAKWWTQRKQERSLGNA